MGSECSGMYRTVARRAGEPFGTHWFSAGTVPSNGAACGQPARRPPHDSRSHRERSSFEDHGQLFGDLSYCFEIARPGVPGRSR